MNGLGEVNKGKGSNESVEVGISSTAKYATVHNMKEEDEDAFVCNIRIRRAYNGQTTVDLSL